MTKKGMAPFGVTTAIAFATGIPVATAAQEAADHAFSGNEPVETHLAVQFEAALIDETPAPAVTSVAGPELDFGGLGCVEEDGTVSLHSSREERAGANDGDCPEWVALDDFEEVDYGDGIGVTMCSLTEEYTVKERRSLAGSISATWKAIFGGGEAKTETEVSRESTRTRCHYYGCDLDVSLSEAVWSTRN